MRNIIPSIVLLSLFTVSCHHADPPTQNVDYRGRMTGRVIPEDVNNDSMTNLFAGTSVSLMGTSIGTTTDANGYWTLDNVPAGIYTILFIKSGFDTTGFASYRFSGAGVDFVRDAYVIRTPDDTLILDYLTAHDTSVQGVHVPFLQYGGHISSKKLQFYTLYCTLDSAIGYGSEGGAGWYVTNGSFGNELRTMFDPKTGQWGLMSSGQRIFFKAQLSAQADLWSVDPRVSAFRRPVPHAYSNVLTVTIP